MALKALSIYTVDQSYSFGAVSCPRGYLATYTDISSDYHSQGATGIEWVEPRELPNTLQCAETPVPPRQEFIQPIMSTVLRLQILENVGGMKVRGGYRGSYSRLIREGRKSRPWSGPRQSDCCLGSRPGGQWEAPAFVCLSVCVEGGFFIVSIL